MQRRRTTTVACAAVLAGFAAGPALAASQPTVEQQIEALREIVERQQGQLDLQQQQLETQRAEIAALRATQGEAPSPAASPRIDAAAPAKAQSPQPSPAPATVRMQSNRATVTSPDGSASLAVRANVQMDYAQYSQDAAGPLTTDFRRGSVGPAGGRETIAAKDLSDGAYFRRARLGVEGVIARDFNYRFLVEFGGSGTEGPARINDAFLAYTGLAPFTFQLGAYSPPANLADGTSTEDLVFIERATPAELSRALGGADGRFGIGVRVAGERGLGALTLTGRAVNDAEVFDSQQAVVGRLGGLVVTAPDYNVHLGANGTYVFQPPDQGGASSLYGLRLRDRPEIRVDSTRLIDTGIIDADSAYAAGVEFAANWKGLLLQAENYWYGVERRASTLADPELRRVLRRSQLVCDRRAPSLRTGQRGIPGTESAVDAVLTAAAAGARGSLPCVTATPT
jgi:phosphate-selective porin OprO and OprP